MKQVENVPKAKDQDSSYDESLIPSRTSQFLRSQAVSIKRTTNAPIENILSRILNYLIQKHQKDPTNRRLGINRQLKTTLIRFQKKCTSTNRFGKTHFWKSNCPFIHFDNYRLFFSIFFKPSLIHFWIKYFLKFLKCECQNFLQRI